VRNTILGLLCLAAAGASASVRADTYPPTTVLIGEISQSIVNNQCYIVRGGGAFLRNGGANRAFVAIPEMTAAGYQLDGRITLVFTSATAGTTAVNYAAAYPATIQAASFQNYNQSYNTAAKTLAVHFTLNFPDCTLPVNATFASP
jgi:hypothetical protein